MGKLPAVLAELKQIVITPIKKYVPSAPVSQSEPLPAGSREGVITSSGDPPDPDDLPSQIFGVMGKGETKTILLRFCISCFRTL